MTLRMLLLATALVAGCGNKKSKDEELKETPKPTAKSVDAAWFGKTVAPPGSLAKVTWGSTEADVKAKAPELIDKPGDDFQLTDEKAFTGVSYGVGFDKETKKLHRLYVQLPAAAEAIIPTAWGPGKQAKDSIDRPRTYWFDPAGGWRAHLEAGFGEDKNLEFRPYMPAAKMLGEGPDTLGFAPQGVVGATVEELRTRFGAQLIETDAKQAAEQQKKVGDFAGKDLAKELGPAKPSVRVDLPPSEWAEFWTRVNFHWGDDGKVREAYFDIPYRAYGPAKDEIKALFEKKWGAPKEAKKYSETIWVYREKDPRVWVEDDTISHAWDVHVSSAAE